MWNFDQIVSLKNWITRRGRRFSAAAAAAVAVVAHRKSQQLFVIILSPEQAHEQTNQSM